MSDKRYFALCASVTTMFSVGAVCVYKLAKTVIDYNSRPSIEDVKGIFDMDFNEMFFGDEKKGPAA